MPAPLFHVPNSVARAELSSHPARITPGSEGNGQGS